MTKHIHDRPSLVFPALLLGLACGGAEPAAKTAPATIAHPIKEADLTSVRLTPEAERRLAIVVAAVEERAVSRTRTVGGEAMVRPGNRVAVTAPRAGTVHPPEGGFPGAGRRVERGQLVANLVPLPADGDILRAEQSFLAAEARALQTRQRLERAETLLVKGAETAEIVEQARADAVAAEASLTAARAERDLVRGAVNSAVAPLGLTAPDAAVVTNLAVGPGQRVVAGTELLALESTHPLWVKVPLYAGDAAGVDARRGAQVQGVGARPGSPGRSARFVPGPPSANAGATAVDLYFEVDNHDARFRPGERVGVTLLLAGERQATVVPWSSVVYDINGGTWVYLRTGEREYTRRRVEVADVVGELAVLQRGAAAGDSVVAVGAAELYSTEFGPAK